MQALHSESAGRFVYTKIVLGWDGNVIDFEGYSYFGPTGRCMAASITVTKKPTPEEYEAMRALAEILLDIFLGLSPEQRKHYELETTVSKNVLAAA